MATQYQTPPAASPIDRMVDIARPFTTFLGEFLRDPGMVASAIPSSAALIEKTLATIDWEKTRTMVEYGPGIGSFTRAALKHMRPDARMIAIDTSASFVRYLDSFGDPRLTGVEGSAVDAVGIVEQLDAGPADVILSGLPFSNLAPGTGDAIMWSSAQLLRSGGQFIAYQFRPAIRPLLAAVFGAVEEEHEWRNVPPLHIYRATK